MRLNVKNTKRQAQIVIGKIDSYYQVHQKYPESLTELGYEKDDLLFAELDVTLHYVKYRDHYYLNLRIHGLSGVLAI